MTAWAKRKRSNHILEARIDEEVRTRRAGVCRSNKAHIETTREQSPKTFTYGQTKH